MVQSHTCRWLNQSSKPFTGPCDHPFSIYLGRKGGRATVSGNSSRSVKLLVNREWRTHVKTNVIFTHLKWFISILAKAKLWQKLKENRLLCRNTYVYINNLKDKRFSLVLANICTIAQISNNIGLALGQNIWSGWQHLMFHLLNTEFCKKNKLTFRLHYTNVYFSFYFH